MSIVKCIASGIVNADGTSSVHSGCTISKEGDGVYGISLQAVSPLARRIVRVSLLWEGGTEDYIIRYSPTYSNDNGASILIRNTSGVPKDAAFSFEVLNIL